jgi:hypothetical protein
LQNCIDFLFVGINYRSDLQSVSLLDIIRDQFVEEMVLNGVFRETFEGVTPGGVVKILSERRVDFFVGLLLFFIFESEVNSIEFLIRCG